MSSYLFKNASRGKVTNVTPNKLAKFVYNKEATADKKDRNNTDKKSKSPIANKRFSKTTKFTNPLSRRSSSPIGVHRDKSPRESKIQAAKIREKSPPQMGKLRNQDLLMPATTLRSKTPD